MSGEAIAVVAAAVGLLAVLVPLLLTIRGDVRDLRAETRAEIGTMRTELRTEIGATRAELHALAERVARIEGSLATLTGPWRPANGAPAPATPETDQ